MDPQELLAWFEPEDGAWIRHSGKLIATKGAASTVVVPPGPDQSARIAETARMLLAKHGGPLVLAVPFDQRSQAVVSAPEETFVTEDPGAPESDPPTGSGKPLRYEPFPSGVRYEEMVAEALKMIESGELTKIVLARMLIAHATEPFDRRRLIADLAANEPDATVFAVNGFIGATPELLVAKRGDLVRSRPLAGTSRRSTDPDGSQLASGGKEAAEHRIVVDAVAEALSSRCTDLSVGSPELVGTSSMWHLGTEVTARADGSTDVLDLVSALHPTPAVCGTPRESARRAIREVEGFDRMIYGGAVGWVDETGDGEWFVALRCAEVRGRMAMLFAGAGIVDGSDPASELAETTAKFAPMQAALSNCC
jgi:isochorismate synthase